MLRSWKLGQAFGIPLYIHPTFLLIVPWVLWQSNHPGLFGVTFDLAVVLTVFGCVLLHELGHALMARYFGIRTRDITLYPIGGVARLNRLSDKPHEELSIALAGPAVNVVIAALLTPLLFLAMGAGLPFGNPQSLSLSDGPWTILAGFGLWIWWANIALVLFNMIPAFPMDGGRVLRAILSIPLGQVRATDIAGRIGLVLATLFAVAAVLMFQPFLLLISFFVALVGHQERLMVRYREARRQAEAPITVEPAPAAPERVRVAPRGFSGVAWDSHYGVWVRWVDGRPVGYYARAE